MFAAAWLCGCASQVATMEGFRPPGPEVALQVVDARPAKEKSSEIMSLAVTSCDYSIRRLGDETTVPSRLALLHADLVRALGSSLNGKALTVTHYTVHYNNGVAMRGGVYAMAPVPMNPLAGAIQGATTALMKSFGSNCPKEKTTEGWFDAAENPGKHSPLIVEIGVTLDGRTYAVRSLHSPSQEFGGRFGDPEPARELFEALRRAHAALADKIARGAG